MIDTQEKLVEHVRRERDVYQDAIARMEDGRLTSHTHNVDTTMVDRANLQGVVDNMDDLLKRLIKIKPA